MQTPQHDDDDSEFSYRLPEDSNRFLQSPRKRRLLLDGSQQRLQSTQSLVSWQDDLKGNNLDNLQYSIASGILSPKSPISLASFGQDESASSVIYDTDRPSVTEWQLTGK